MDTNSGFVITRGKGGQGKVDKGKGGHISGDKRKLNFGCWTHSDILSNCTLETYMTPLTNVIPIILIKKKR